LDWKSALEEAVLRFSSGSAHEKGPCIFLLPKDIQQNLWVMENSPVPATPVQKNSWTAQDLRLLEDRRPLVILGEELDPLLVQSSLLPWLEKNELPVAVTAGGKACMSFNHPLYQGVVGALGHPGFSLLAEQQGSFLIIGTRMLGMDRFDLDHELKRLPGITLSEEHSRYTEHMKSFEIKNWHHAFEMISQISCAPHHSEISESTTNRKPPARSPDSYTRVGTANLPISLRDLACELTPFFDV
jgi:thiamine pyrophosphate-dependent acetolactate synthase large subunit-like protein